jgi:hypothetical protein
MDTDKIKVRQVWLYMIDFYLFHMSVICSSILTYYSSIQWGLF